MSPPDFLIIAIFVLALAIGLQTIFLRRSRRKLRKLARQWGMHFVSGDRFRLAERVVPQLQIPGAADVRVRDLFFCTMDHRHRYLFTVEFTVGAVHGKVCRCSIMGFEERITRRGVGAPTPVVTVAPAHLPAEEAYQFVRDILARQPSPG